MTSLTDLVASNSTDTAVAPETVHRRLGVSGAGESLTPASASLTGLEYLLVIGVVAIGIVLLFMSTPIEPAFTALVSRVACLVSGQTWLAATSTCA